MTCEWWILLVTVPFSVSLGFVIAAFWLGASDRR
jgi:hypothetical protein